MFKRAPKQHSPDRARSIARRRRGGVRTAAAGAANYTTSELAVIIKIVADEVAFKGFCDLDIPQNGARQVSRHTVRNACAAELEAQGAVERRILLGYPIEITHPRRAGGPSSTRQRKARHNRPGESMACSEADDCSVWRRFYGGAVCRRVAALALRVMNGQP